MSALPMRKKKQTKTGSPDWEATERRLHKDLLLSMKSLGEKAKEGDVKAVSTLLTVYKQLRHTEDPRSVVADFATALVTLLENDGHEKSASIVTGYLEQAADKVLC